MNVARCSLAVFATSALALAAYAVSVGKDVNWDLMNYHDYAPWALLHGGYDRDVLPGNYQSYFNPVVYLVRYAIVAVLRPPAASASLAMVQAANIPLVFCIAHVLLSSDSPAWRLTLASTAAGLASLSAVFLTEIATSFADILSSAIVLGSVLVLVRMPGGGARESATRSLLLCGFLCGAAVGLKWTNTIFALGLVPAVALGWSSWRDVARAPVLLALGGVAGALVVGGPWALKLWVDHRNPFFPFFSDLFNPSESLMTTVSDRRFLPSSVLDGLTYPLKWARGIQSSAEVPFTDVRYVLLVIAAAGATLRAWVTPAARRDFRPTAGHARFFAFMATAFFFWLYWRAIHRYIVAVDLLVGPAIVLCTRFVLPPMKATAAVLGAMLAAAGTVEPPNYGRAAWSRAWFDVTLPDALHEPGTYVLVSRSGLPLGFLPPLFPGPSTFIQATYPAYVPPGSTLAGRAERAFASAAAGTRPFMAIVDAAPGRDVLHRVAGFGLRLSLPCQTIGTAVRPLVACRLEHEQTASHVVEPRVRIGEWMSFATPGGAAALFGRGWSIPEEKGTWATGPRSTLRLRVEPPAPETKLVMEADIQALVAPGKAKTDIRISVAKRPAAPWRYDGDGGGAPTRRTVCLQDDGVRAGRPFEITFRNRDPRSPASLGLNSDARLLSFKVLRARVREAEPRECPG